MIEAKKRILLAATKEFAQQGFNAASIGQIAQIAGISKASVFHHFENKNQLYMDVMLETFNEVAEIWSTSLQEDSGDFVSDLKILITNTLEFQTNNEDAVKLLIREVMDNSNDKKPSIAPPIIRQYFQQISLTIEKAISKSKYKKILNPSDLAYSILSYSLFKFIFGTSLSNMEELPGLKNQGDYADWIVSNIPNLADNEK